MRRVPALASRKGSGSSSSGRSPGLTPRLLDLVGRQRQDERAAQLIAHPVSDDWRPVDVRLRLANDRAPTLGVLCRQALVTMARMSVRQQAARALRAAAWRIERPPRSRRRQAAPPLDPGALMRADSAPGSRPASWFFEQFPRFYWTSSTAPTTARLNLRYEAITIFNGGGYWFC